MRYQWATQKQTRNIEDAILRNHVPACLSIVEVVAELEGIVEIKKLPYANPSIIVITAPFHCFIFIQHLIVALQHRSVARQGLITMQIQTRIAVDGDQTATGWMLSRHQMKEKQTKAEK